MATRTKTIQYAFPIFTGIVADATVTNLTPTTIYIPETVTSFISVSADLGFADIITATGGTIASMSLGLSLNASAYTTITDSAGVTNTGESLGGVISGFNFTSLFSSTWSGTSMTVDAQVFFDQTTGTTLGMRNVSVTLDISYEYDDTASIQAKTVYIPLESTLTSLSTTANTNIGTNQIPILTGGSGILPENGVTIRDYYFLVEGNDQASGTTDMTLTVNIDSGTAFAFGPIEGGLTTARYNKLIFKPGSVPSTTAAHNFQMWGSGTFRFYHLAITMVVTYEFTLASTSRTINSLLIPFTMNTPLGATTSAEASRVARDLYISEPGTITLRQSGFRLNWNIPSFVTNIYLKAGAQAYRTYTTAPSATTSAGMTSVQQRIDSGSSQGAAITLVRGKNTLIIDGYTTGTALGTRPTNLTGYFVLNYESDIASQGIGAHAHTVKKAVYSSLTPYTLLRLDNINPSISETNYRLISAGYIFSLATSYANTAYSIDAECLSTEGKGAGYYDIYTDLYQSDPEISLSIMWLEGRDIMRRWPDDPGADRIDFKTPRDYRVFLNDPGAGFLTMLYTYQALSFTVTGTISGSAGGTVTINVYRANDRELLYKTTRVGNGTYSFVWYDNTVQIYAEAYEDATHFGRSANVTPGVSAPDVNFGAGPSVQVVARAYTG